MEINIGAMTFTVSPDAYDRFIPAPKQITSTALTVKVGFSTFAAWWAPFTLGVGPAGAFLTQLDEEGRDLVRTRCAQLLPSAPFEVSASAWCALPRA